LKARYKDPGRNPAFSDRWERAHQAPPKQRQSARQNGAKVPSTPSATRPPQDCVNRSGTLAIWVEAAQHNNALDLSQRLKESQHEVENSGL